MCVHTHAASRHNRQGENHFQFQELKIKDRTTELTFDLTDRDSPDLIRIYLKLSIYVELHVKCACPSLLLAAIRTHSKLTLECTCRYCGKRSDGHSLLVIHVGVSQ